VAQEEADRHGEAARQYTVGMFNRRVAVETENLLQQGFATGNETVQFLCTCGRDDCDQVLTIRLDEYRFVREKPYRFLVAPGHDADIDDVIHREHGYWVVEVKPDYRLPL
jgi:hypothetical protein